MLSNAQRSVPTQGDGHEYQSITTGVYDDDLDPESNDDGLTTPSNVKEESRHRGVYLPFWALGAGVLLTWNALLCTIPLLTSFFPIDSSIRPSLASYISTTYCFGNLFFLGAAQRQVGKVSPSSRLHWSLLLSLLTSTLLAFPLLPLILPRLPPIFLLIILSFITLLFSLSTAYLQSAVFALASLWGSKEMLAVMSGQGGIAVLVSFTQLLLALLATKNPNPSTPGGEGEPLASTTAGVGLWALGSLGTILCIFAHKKLQHHQDYHDVLATVTLRAAATTTTGGGDRPLYANAEDKIQSATMRVFWKNWELELAVAWVFVITLAVFPAITTTIGSTHATPVPRLLQPDIFIPLHFVIFNIGDYIGRTYLPAIPSLLVRSTRRVLLLSFSRTLFIPLLLACNTNTPRSTTPFFNSDLMYFFIILSFSMTNGWIGSLCMIISSSPSLNPKIQEEEKDIAGTLAAFCLVAGLAAGSISSFAVTWAVGHL